MPTPSNIATKQIQVKPSEGQVSPSDSKSSSESKFGQAPIYTTKVRKLLTSSEASSQKFLEYIQNGCLKEVKLSKPPFWGGFAAPKGWFG